MLIIIILVLTVPVIKKEWKKRTLEASFYLPRIIISSRALALFVIAVLFNFSRKHGKTR